MLVSFCNAKEKEKWKMKILKMKRVDELVRGEDPTWTARLTPMWSTRTLRINRNREKSQWLTLLILQRTRGTTLRWLCSSVGLMYKFKFNAGWWCSRSRTREDICLFLRHGPATQLLHGTTTINYQLQSLCTNNMLFMYEVYTTPIMPRLYAWKKGKKKKTSYQT